MTPTGRMTLEHGDVRTLVNKCDELTGRKLRLQAEIDGNRTDTLTPEQMSAFLTVHVLSKGSF